MKNIITRVLICAILLTYNYIAAQQITNENGTRKDSLVNEVDKEESVQLLTNEPTYYCVLEMKGSYTQHEDAFNTLYGEIRKQELGLRGFPSGIYWNNPRNTPVEELKWELGMFADAGLQVKPPLKIKKWDFPLVAARMYEGTFDTEEENKAITELFTWINSNGYIPAGPLVRRFLIMPQRNGEGEWAGKDKIIIPVKKK